jgi:hypothetical protein
MGRKSWRRKYARTLPRLPQSKQTADEVSRLRILLGAASAVGYAALTLNRWDDPRNWPWYGLILTDILSRLFATSRSSGKKAEKPSITY